MDLSYIKKVIKLVEKSDVDEIEIEEEGKKIRVAKRRNSIAPVVSQAAYPFLMAAMPVQPSAGTAPALSAPAPTPEIPQPPAKRDSDPHKQPI